MFWWNGAAKPYKNNKNIYFGVKMAEHWLIILPRFNPAINRLTEREGDSQAKNAKEQL